MLGGSELKKSLYRRIGILKWKWKDSLKRIDSIWWRLYERQFMEKNRVGNSERAGFWSESTLVQSVDDIDKILNINMEVL